MKAKLLCLVMLVFLAGCFLFRSPTVTVKSFMAAAEKGDVDGMTKHFSSKAIQKTGLAKIRSNNQSLADRVREVAGSGGYGMQNVQETKIPFDGRRISFSYANELGNFRINPSIKLVFDLSKEGGVWKIDHIGGAEMEGGVILDTPTPDHSPVIQEPPPPPPPLLNDKSETTTGASSKTVSGGILNGKAISLPTPAYPPIAKAAHASGTVVVQVIIDDHGNVLSATAISGHPLLRAAAVAAARGAKFTPTKLGGESVKVNGVITYNFAPE
jgi:TonB family protein